jgi:diguanylate cyclase (GGDEF)-like protein
MKDVMGKQASNFIEINRETNSLQFNSQEVKQKLLNLAYQQAKAGFIASFLCAAVILIGLLRPTDNTLVISWFLLTLFIIAIRGILVSVYAFQKRPERHYRSWRNVFIAFACVAGLTWGLMGAVLYTQANDIQRLLIILVISGVTAGSVPLLSGVILASVGFLSFSLLPLIINILFIKSQISLIFDFTLFTYWLYMIALSYKTHSILRRSFALQFENYALLTSLTEAKSALEESNIKLEQAATHDPLTNAANRNLFNDNIELAIQRAKQKNKKLALLFIDLDDFKEVNDLYGHAAGDLVLLEVIKRLAELCRYNDNISRLGGDEFTIILENILGVKDVAAISRRLCEAIAQSIKINGNEVRISASIGISIYPDDGEEVEMLIHSADKSMYFVKQKGGNDFLFSTGQVAN